MGLKNFALLLFCKGGLCNYQSQTTSVYFKRGCGNSVTMNSVNTAKNSTSTGCKSYTNQGPKYFLHTVDFAH